MMMPAPPPLSRRVLLQSAAAAATLAGSGLVWQRYQEVPATVRYPGQALGHWLRDTRPTAPSNAPPAFETDVAILGSGAAALSAAWAMQRAGFEHWALIEGPEWMGNAAGGQWGDLAYPTGAHYLPLPSSQSAHVRDMLLDVGILKASANGSAPVVDERAIVHAPAERLLARGQWHEGLLSDSSVPTEERDQIHRFVAQMQTLQNLYDDAGVKVFAVPMVLSSASLTWRALDAISFATWLAQQGYTAPSLLAHCDYCCRDDYGRTAQETSAYAGLAYFCAHNGHAANAQDGAVLTWPNGLAHLLQQLAHKAGIASPNPKRLPYSAAQVRTTADGVLIDLVRPAMTSAAAADPPIERTQLRAKRVICALPLYVASRVVQNIQRYGFDPAQHLPTYTPWLVANFFMDKLPIEREGAELAWDNVVQGSADLGYVNATHQHIGMGRAQRTVFTSYQALSHLSPKAARQWLLQASPQDLLTAVSDSLRTSYGWRLAACAAGVEITVRGHAMASPVPGFLSNQGLRHLQQSKGPVYFAHSDLSGYSVFEEAAWWGVEAARKVLG